MSKPANMNRVRVEKKRKAKYVEQSICGKCGNLTTTPCRSTDAAGLCAFWGRAGVGESRGPRDKQVAKIGTS